MTGQSLDEFMKTLDRVVEPIYRIDALKKRLFEEQPELIQADPQPKYMRRKKGEKRPTDRWDYGEKGIKKRVC